MWDELGSKNQLTLGIEIKKNKNKKGKNRIVFQVPLQSRHYGHFFHFLRQNKINKALSVLIKYWRLVPRSQVLPFRTWSYVWAPTDSVHARFNFRQLLSWHDQCPKIALHAQLSSAWNKNVASVFKNQKMARETIKLYFSLIQNEQSSDRLNTQ